VEKNDSARWFVVYVQSGYEMAVKTRLEEEIRRAGMDELFSEILIPSQETDVLKAGKKVQVEKKVFQGYVLINMVMNDETLHVVKNIPFVSGFLGTEMKPMPLSSKDAESFIHRLESKKKSFDPGISYFVGEQVKVIDGPFASLNGVIECVDEEKSLVKVSVSIFGRSTEVDLAYTQVEKL
ncbi:MAG: transcription termination/antitermination protein NusG, partial [Spirochaetaceae bacterium]|nr:transcription termination/antitermination protein NusG [Spirochaetaceae bacterium]